MMTPRFQIKPLIVAFLTAVLMISALPAFAQAGSEGSIVVTALDSSGAVIPGAKLTLTALRTNDTRTAVTANDGSHTFVNLAIGTYSLTIEKPEYDSREYSAIVVQASHVSAITATLPVGKSTQTIRVNAESIPVMDTTSNAIGTVVDVKQIEDLPLSGRDISAFAATVPGYSGTVNGNATFNGLPLTDQGNNINGMASSTTRMKFGGNMSPDVEPRLEDIEQMTVQTDQLDLNSGFGQATTQLNFVLRRGSNQFHGRIFEDFRNSWLNANSWTNDARGNKKNKLILNDFGATISGPAWRNKLFFFGSFATRRQPGGYTNTNNVLTPDAQAGNFTWTDKNGTHTANVLDVAHSQDPSLPNTINSLVSSQQAVINSSLSSGVISPTSDPNLKEISWSVANPSIRYYPSFRVDYNASQKARFYLSYLEEKRSSPAGNAAPFPGAKFIDQQSGNSSKNYTASFGFNYTFSPTIINQLTAGYLYNSSLFGYNASDLAYHNPFINWAYGDSGQNYGTGVNTYYPILNFDDAMTVQKKGHTFQFGVSWYREQDHYWNPALGYINYNLGMDSADPATNALTYSSLGMDPSDTTDLGTAQALWATLVGRLASSGGSSVYHADTGKYNPPGTVQSYALDEVSSAWGLFFEDSWKLSPTLTLNYGLRWDIYAPEKDLTGVYHSATEANLYGPTAVGDLFKPGQLNGVQDPKIVANDAPYKPWRVTPQPAIGFAWNPRVESGSPLHALLGNGDTVVRGGFALRRFTEPYQYYWNYATGFASFYYQNFNLQANNSGATGSFAPGSLSLGDSLPPFSYAPETFVDTAPLSDFTFLGGVPTTALEPNLKQPYSESWNFGVQRMIGHNLALEVRYNGNRTLHNWMVVDPNEVNVFENGFLKDFQNAQANLAASGGTSFSSSYGNPTPILDAAFGGPNSSDYKSSTYRNYLNNGRVGSLANTLAGIGNQDYFCNLVGPSFAPCVNNIGYEGAGAGYPINFFQANPYSINTGFFHGNDTSELVSAGTSNYNALQIDLRQGNWHGLQYDANYTWAHGLGIGPGNDWTGSSNVFTVRDLRRGYGPTTVDLRNVFHGNGTYDLPFGKGRQYLNGNRFLDETVGGWTVGTIVSWQTGSPFQLTGGNRTFNDYADGGIVMNNLSVKQLQSAVGVHTAPGQSFVNIIDPKYLGSPTTGRANTQFITPNKTAGVIGQTPYLHGPRQFAQDMSLSKAFPIRETMRFKLQASFLNVWNHPEFGNSTGSITSSSFGHGGITGFGARQIEFRGNFEF